jgi:DNA-directed RNA polymerase I subunit RPA1
MVSIVERVAPQCVIREVPGIAKCFLSENRETGQLVMTTDGVNIRGVWDFVSHLDISGLESNDIAAILATYGVEAARKTIIREISSVFAVYGIEVDTRHLTLIADYMTFEGGYKPFNRIGIESSVSPFAKMSFETTFHFLTDATLRGDTDSLHNPSARLVMGQVVEGGTGSFSLLQSLQPMASASQ